MWQLALGALTAEIFSLHTKICISWTAACRKRQVTLTIVGRPNTVAPQDGTARCPEVEGDTQLFFNICGHSVNTFHTQHRVQLRQRIKGNVFPVHAMKYGGEEVRLHSFLSTNSMALSVPQAVAKPRGRLSQNVVITV